jgi:hypothetical protein
VYFGVGIIVNGSDAHSKESDARGIVVCVKDREPGDRSVLTNLNSSKGTVEYAASKSALRDPGEIRESRIASNHEGSLRMVFFWHSIIYNVHWLRSSRQVDSLRTRIRGLPFRESLVVAVHTRFRLQ